MTESLESVWENRGKTPEVIRGNVLTTCVGNLLHANFG